MSSLLDWLFGTEAPRHVHDFGKWNNTQVGNLVRSHDGGIIGTVAFQSRECKTCGLIETRSDESWI